MRTWIYRIVLASVCLGGFLALYAQKSEPFTIQSEGLSSQPLFPVLYTCHGENISPDISWSNIPQGTKSFALITHDIDAHQYFTHWVIYNIPPTTSILPEALGRLETLPNGAIQGKNSFDRIGYDGPCPPPPKVHHYVFTLYALDTMLTLKPGSNAIDLKNAMQGHILGETKMTGMFLNSEKDDRGQEDVEFKQ